MPSLLLSAAVRIVAPLQILISVILFLRGHNEPGGGFIGGLMAGTAVILYGLAFGMPAAVRLVRLRPQIFIGLGLLLAGASGLPGLFANLPYLTGIWTKLLIPTVLAGLVKIGTPLLFDLGVYFVVFGIALLITFSMAEEAPEDS
jgi:multicomponent Na+:H+ antiporter subunit B